MKQIFFQLKTNISKYIQCIIKKPLFLEIIIGSVFSFIIIVMSVSGFDKEVYRDQFDSAEITDNPESEEYVDEDELISWDELDRGDALSEIEEDITASASINRDTSISTPSPTRKVEIVTIAPTMVPTVTLVPEVNEEIEELPEVTLVPEVTSTPEPEVILDPNGPVIVTDYEDMFLTTSHRGSISITAYNPSGDKLDNNFIEVKLNDSIIYPNITYNGAFTYLLDYTYGINNIVVNVHDENNNSKTYEYLAYYDIPIKKPAVISVDAASVGLGYMIQPTAVEITEGKTVASYVKEILSQNGYSTFSKGSQNFNYEFRGLYRSDLYNKCEPEISNELLITIFSNSTGVNISDNYRNFIKNDYFLTGSKWIFEINGVKYFDSMSNYTLNEGDILKVRFSLCNGIDLDYIDNYFIPEDTTEEQDIKIEP